MVYVKKVNKIIWKKLFFSFVTLIILLLSFEAILSFGGYFYFYVYSNLDRPKIEEDAFRILFLGESTTQGGGLGEGNETYSTQVEKILQQKYFGKKVKSYNKGIGAIKTADILRNLDRNMVKYKPNLVVSMAGYNDDRLSGNMTFVDDIFKSKKVYSVSKLYRLVTFIKDILKFDLVIFDEGDFRYAVSNESSGVQYFLPYRTNKFSVPSSRQTISNLNAMVQKIHSYGSEIWFVGYLQPDAGDKVNPVLKKIAKENNIVYIGDYPEIDFQVNRSLFIEDGWHPNEEGHRIIAEKIAERIIQEGIIDHWQP